MALSDCSGCVALVDEHGRGPIGWCGPDCTRRAWRQRVINLDRFIEANGRMPRSGEVELP